MRLLRHVILVSLFLVLGVGAVTAEPSEAADPTDDPIVVISISDPMDQLSIDYVIEAIESEPAYLYILRIDSPGVSSGNVAALYEVIESAPAPVVSWIGPFGAVAFGGSAYIANHADIRSGAPGAVVGYLDPVVQRGSRSRTLPAGTDEMFADTTVELTPDGELISGLVDRLDPALSTLLISLDGTTVTREDQTWELSTARVETVEGEDIVVATHAVKFVGPGLMDRLLRLASRPEATFLFLLIGLAFAVFEFYAAGRGLMAAVASVSILLAGYGAATLPVWWPAVGITTIGLGILVWGLSKNRVDWRAVLGTAMLLVGGFTLTTSRPAYPPAAWMVILAVAASVTFIWYSLTSVVRGRFATPTVGREELLGRRCLAVSDLDPGGVVLIDGARWSATADRGVMIGSGAAVQIVGLTGLVLEVDPVAAAGREEIS